MHPSSLAILALLVLVPQEGDKPAATPNVRVRISSERRLNPAKAMSVRFTIENATDGEIEIEEPADYLAGLEVLDDAGKVLRAFGKDPEKKRSVKIDKGGFIGRVVDIRPAIVESKAGEGLVKVTWRYGGAVSNTVEPWIVKDWTATLDTTLGEIRLEFLPETAPRHVLNFIDLARTGKYDGTSFHRVIPGFMAQAGQQKEPLGFRLKAEFSSLPHDIGTLSMARTHDPDSASAEFFICFARLAGLDGKYTVFGQMVAGEPVLRKIEKAPTDHSPCPGCGKSLDPKSTSCCGAHHEDRPKVDIVIKKIVLLEKDAK
ncbi:MAG TPA: peptidylprolyl isomerase [Planctomycetota bacterium]|nr:peptidylprolyl isomerase [Planctomycetota bacterium]